MRAFMVIPALALSPLAHADILLGTYQFVGQGHDPQNAGVVEPVMSYSDPDVLTPFGYMGNQTIDLADVANGTVKTLSGDFLGFSLAMTSNTDEQFHIGFRVPGGMRAVSLINESSLTPEIAGVVDPDFAGYALTRVTVLGTSYSTLGGGSFEFGLLFSIYGDVPAPSTGLIACAFAAAGMRRRR